MMELRHALGAQTLPFCLVSISRLGEITRLLGLGIWNGKQTHERTLHTHVAPTHATYRGVPTH